MGLTGFKNPCPIYPTDAKASVFVCAVDKNENRGVAQSGLECCPWKAEAIGSNPIIPTSFLEVSVGRFSCFRNMAQFGSAPAWGAGGRRFKSGYSDH